MFETKTITTNIAGLDFEPVCTTKGAHDDSRPAKFLILMECPGCHTNSDEMACIDCKNVLMQLMDNPNYGGRCNRCNNISMWNEHVIKIVPL